MSIANKIKKLTVLGGLLLMIQSAPAAFHQDWSLTWQKGKNEDEPQQLITLYHEGKQVYQIAEHTLELPSFELPAVSQERESFLVVQGYTGGAHCCSWVKIIPLKLPIKEVVHHEIQGVPPVWVDVDKDGVLELITSDYTFDYWYTSHSASALPTVILRFKENALVPDAKLMDTPRPTEREFLQLVNTLKSDKSYWESTPSEDSPFSLSPLATGAITSQIIKFLYEGHPDLAKRFLNQVWPKNNPKKEIFIKLFNEQLHKSPYWESLTQQGRKGL